MWMMPRIRRYKSAPGYYGVCPRAEDPIHVYQVFTRKRGHCNFANLRETHMPYTTRLETVVEVFVEEKKKLFLKRKSKALGVYPVLQTPTRLTFRNDTLRACGETQCDHNDPAVPGMTPGEQKKDDNIS